MAPLYPIHHRLKAIAAVIVTAVMGVTCDLVTSPESGRTIRVEFGTAEDSLIRFLVVHRPVAVYLTVTEGGVPLEGVSFEIISLDDSIVRVIPPSTTGGAFSLEATRRGQARIRARLLGSAFADNPPTGDTTVVGVADSLDVDSAQVTFVNLGDSVQLTATAFDGLDQVLVGANPTWTTSNAASVSVDQTGKIRAVANDTALITATLDNRSDQVTVVVNQILRGYAFSPPAVTLTSLGQTRQVTVTPLDGAGNPIPASVTLPAPAFSSSNSGVVQVTASGYTATLTALTNGAADIRVVGGAADDTLRAVVGQEAKTVVIGQGEAADTIDALGETLQLLATVRDTLNVALPANLPVTWLTNNPAIANVDADGTVEATGLGAATIIALRAPAADTITIVVRNIPRRVGLTETIAIPTVGDTVQAQDTITNSRGAVVPGAAVLWRSVDSTIAAVTTTGRVIARSIGTTKVVGTIDTALGCFGGNCADTIAVTVANEPTSVNIAAAAITLNSIGDTVTAVSTILNARSDSLPRSAVSWSSGNPNVATVSNDGLIQAVSAGATQVIATVPSGNDADTVAVTVTNAPVSLTLNRTRDTLTAPTSTLQYQASVRNAAGALIPGATVTFTSTRASAASVSGTGLATQNAQFLDSTLVIAEVTGAAGTRADTAVLVVRNDAVTIVLDRGATSIGAINDTAHFRATALNSANQAVPGVQFTWSTANPLIATVSATGIVTAVAIGNTTVSAQLTGGTLASVPTQITVTNAPTTIVFDSTAITLRSVGDTLTTTGVYQNRLGITLSRTAAAWSSDGAGIATVSPDGIVTAVGRGTTKIRARSPLPGSQTEDSLFVTVTNAPASINVLPDSVSTLPSLGRTLSFSADVFNARGGQIPGEPVSWLSRNTGIATVSAAGVVTSVDTGSVYIVGSATGPSGTVRDSARVIVRNLASEVEFSPASVSFASLGNQQLVTITARNEQGNPIPNSLVTWTSSNTASVRFRTTPAGPAVVGPVVTRDTVRIEAVATGSATLSATVDGITNSIGVSVSNPPATVQITSGNLTIASVNDTVVPSVNFLNAVGGALPRNAVLWTTSNPNVATVSSNGDVVATGSGVATITATSPVNAALTSSITVTVTNAPASVTLNATNNTLTALGRTLQYIATVRNARNDVITTPSLSWSSNNGAVASVDPATGLATANAVGGPVTITATASSTVGPLVQAAANASLTVTNFAVSLTLAPDTVTVLDLGTTTQLAAVARNDLNNLLPAAAIVFATLDPARAGVNAAGLVTVTAVAGNVGVARITATVASSGTTNLVDTTFVTVVNAPRTLNIVPANRTLASVGDTAFPQLTLQNAGGAALARTAALWASSATNVATVSNDGVVTALAPGVTTINATSPYDPSLTDSYTVTVTNAPASVVLNQTNVTLSALGRTTTFTAVVRNARNDAIPSASVTWTSNLAAVGIGLNTGIATANAVTGGATITATVVGAPAITATANVVVTNDAAAINVSPSAIAFTSVSGTQALTISVLNDLGNVIAGAPVSVVSNNLAVATITGTTVNAAGVGGTTVSVTSGTASASVSVTVTDGTLPATITLDRAALTVTALGADSVVTPTVRNSVGTALPGALLTWSQAPAGVLTLPGGAVAGAQTVSGLAVGTTTLTVTTANGLTAQLSATVRNDVTSVNITTAGSQAAPFFLTTGDSLLAAITLQNSEAAAITDRRAVTWTSTNPSIASVADSGMIHGQGTGTAIIRAVSPTNAAARDSIFVNVGALDHFLVEADVGGSIGTQNAGVAFTIRITAQNAANQTVTGFNGTVTLTSTGTLTGAPLVTATFVNGVLASQSVTITNTGSFTITATRTGGTQSGTSNAFTVDP